jgi:branched-chain amino acid transport system permease protein
MVIEEKYIKERSYVLMALAILYLVLPLVFIDMPYVIFILTQMNFYLLFAFAFNFLFGLTNQLFLSVGAFAGIGAYITGILLREGMSGPVEAVILSTLLVAGIGYLVSTLSVKRRLVVIFTGVFTLAITLVFTNLTIALVTITGGETGFRIRGVNLWILDWLPHNIKYYYLSSAILLVVTILAYYILFYTKMGYAYQCILADELTAELIGIYVQRVKTLTGLFASALLGLSGSIYGLFSQLIAPSYFAFASVDLPVQLIVILGGRGTLLGPYIGAAVITVVNELLRLLGPLTLVIYGVTLIFLLAFFRNGIIEFLKRNLAPWLF